MNGIVTKIERQRNDAHRFNIYIDGNYAASVHEDVLIQHNIQKGRRLDDNEWEYIINEEENNKARQKALRWLSYRARTEREVFRYLVGQGFTQERARAVVDWLKKYDLIDDATFAKSWVESRRRLKGWSKQRLRHELNNKGVDEQQIDEALSTLSEEEDLALARQWAHKRYKQLQHAAWKTVERRLGAYLARRGFRWSHIQMILHELREHHQNND